MQKNTDQSGIAVLIAGSAHTRKDRGIPRYLEADQVISIALIEAPVVSTLEDVIPTSIEEGTTPYDYVWFTPKIEKKTLCDRLAAAKQE